MKAPGADFDQQNLKHAFRQTFACLLLGAKTNEHCYLRASTNGERAECGLRAERNRDSKVRIGTGVRRHSSSDHLLRLSAFLNVLAVL